MPDIWETIIAIIIGTLLVYVAQTPVVLYLITVFSARALEIFGAEHKRNFWLAGGWGRYVFNIIYNFINKIIYKLTTINNKYWNAHTRFVLSKIFKKLVLFDYVDWINILYFMTDWMLYIFYLFARTGSVGFYLFLIIVVILAVLITKKWDKNLPYHLVERITDHNAYLFHDVLDIHNEIYNGYYRNGYAPIEFKIMGFICSLISFIAFIIVILDMISYIFG